MANTETIVYEAIRSDWHKLTTPEGVFFGYSEGEARGKADQAKKHAEIALEVRREHIAEMQSSRRSRFL
jgi:hypothetical protein